MRILNNIKEELSAVIKSQGLGYIVLGGADVQLSNGILKAFDEADILSDEIAFYARSLGVLNVDLFLLVINPANKRHEVIIGEVKDIPSLGLKEYSQLVGYCLGSYATYGLLINVDRGVSKNLVELLYLDDDLSTVKRVVRNEEIIYHQFGVFKWNSTNCRIESLELGKIRSLSEIAIDICNKLSLEH